MTKYPGRILDAKLAVERAYEEKSDELNIKLRKMYWWLRRNSEL
jgi:hypothetical protein